MDAEDLLRVGAGMQRAESFHRMPRPCPITARHAHRGFTLVELLIVVAMVGVMAALAIVGYRKYLNSAQSSEAKAMIQGIRAGEEAYKAEMLVYLSCSSSLTDWYPRDPSSVFDKKTNWVQPSDVRYSNPTNGWQLLNVQADGPVRFGYAVMAGIKGKDTIPTPTLKTPITGWPPNPPDGTPFYVVQAMNQRSASAAKVMMVSSSFSSEIFSENEDQ